MNQGRELTEHHGEKKPPPGERGEKAPTDREPGAKDAPVRERRASHRVSDDQKSGQGSLSALSKLKMLERKRAAIKPAHED